MRKLGNLDSRSDVGGRIYKVGWSTFKGRPNFTAATPASPQGAATGGGFGCHSQPVSASIPLNTAFSPKDTSVAEHYPCAVDPTSLEEVCLTVRQMRNSRVPGEDA